MTDVDRAELIHCDSVLNMKCVLCIWYIGTTEEGECRRHNPSMDGFPRVKSNDWCGEYKQDDCPGRLEKLGLEQLR